MAIENFGLMPTQGSIERQEGVDVLSAPAAPETSGPKMEDSTMSSLASDLSALAFVPPSVRFGNRGRPKAFPRS